MNNVKVALISALALHAQAKAEEIIFTPFGNHYPAATKSKGHAACQKRESKKRKSK
ncbi:MAG: hypothetical protein [Caudoviricetes sp.]|nr:MAG: hypothetical protein [Caudoviricetes sp.]